MRSLGLGGYSELSANMSGFMRSLGLEGYSELGSYFERRHFWAYAISGFRRLL